MDVNSVYQQAMNYFNGTAIYIQIFVVVLFTLILQAFESVAYKRIKPTLQKTKTVWDEAFLEATHKPLSVLIWFLGLFFALNILQIETNGAAIYKLIDPVRELITIIIFVWFLIRLVKQFEINLTKPKTGRKAVDVTTVSAISQILRAAIIITTILITLQTFGYNISGVLTIGGVGGIIIGLAAKDLLANFFGGLMVYYDRPFKVGDWVRSPDRNIEGTVQHIGWRLTRIRTFDQRPLFVPNSVFSTISVENPSRMLNRRIKTLIGLRYDDAPKAAVILKDVETMLRNHPEIDTKQTLMVCLVEFGTSALNFMVYTFTKTTKWVDFQMIQQDVFLKIIDIITKHGAECAFPTTTMHVPEDIEIQLKEAQS